MHVQAIKGGHWVLLDELNLADQSVLEGLNAVLDHRQEVFIPELGEVVRCPPTFRLFAAQNPLQEGGGRKGLPKSFLNRFSRVLVDLLESSDLHPSLGQAGLMNCRQFGQQGAPWGSTVTCYAGVTSSKALHTLHRRASLA
jgi:hypothetical protein